jgi:hypothetical protein
MSGLPIDLATLPGPAQKLLSPAAPGPAKIMAARGIIPGLKPAEIVTVIALLTLNEDAKVADAARTSFAKLPPPMLTGALGGDLHEFVIDQLVEHYAKDADAVEKLLRLPNLSADSLTLLAMRATEHTGELIATNEKRLLTNPRAIERLYMNKQVRMSTADRLLELAVRNNLELDIPAFKEAAIAIQHELIVEPTPEPTFDDLLFKETEQVAAVTVLAGDEDTHEVDDEGEEKLVERFLPLYQRVAQMNVTQKIRRALLGSAAERMLLVRDPNRLVAMAVAKSPMMREDEAARISASRAVGEDVLREIAKNRDFTRNYQVKLNLVSNPRTPFTFASRLISHLRESDLRSLAKSKNVPGAVSTAVRQQLQRKQPGGGKR